MRSRRRTGDMLIKGGCDIRDNVGLILRGIKLLHKINFNNWIKAAWSNKNRGGSLSGNYTKKGTHIHRGRCFLFHGQEGKINWKWRWLPTDNIDRDANYAINKYKAWDEPEKAIAAADCCGLAFGAFAVGMQSTWELAFSSFTCRFRITL